MSHTRNCNMTQPNHRTVKKAFAQIPGANVSWNDGIEKTVVTVPDNQVGKAFGVLRRNDFESVQRRLGDSITYHIDSNRERLFRGIFE